MRSRRRFLQTLPAALLLPASSCNRHPGVIIGVIPKGRAHIFWQSVHAGAVKAAQEGGAKVLWNGPTEETDYTGQIEVVESMINRHVSAIAVAPIDKRAIAGVIDRAAEAKIPVILFDSGVDTKNYVSLVATDNYAAGQLAAERLASLLGGKGRIVMVKVEPGAASTEAREKGFTDVITSKYPGIEIVDQRYGMADFAKSLTVAENMLTAHPDLTGMFASNESSTVGAAQALRGRGGKIKLVGFDWSPALKESLENGIIDTLVVQNPFQMGYIAVQSALKTLHGEAVPKSQPLPPTLVDRTNLHQPEIQALLNPDLKKYLN